MDQRRILTCVLMILAVTHSKDPVCRDDEKVYPSCMTWEGEGLCVSDKAKMKKHCPLTCRYCEPACSQSKHGCCWDNTNSPDPFKLGCMGCKDRYLVLCQRMVGYCDKEGRNGYFMSRNCPKTCQICPHNINKSREFSLETHLRRRPRGRRRVPVAVGENIALETRL
uniref:Toxin candidate TRINITY_DN18288_c0_g1_i2 n=1 Tax=Isarachnanthus nocturnus TaxID=1240238 RepID=A0A7G7WZ37_9CNID|nr:toxin candidate TRINITY_DN18288_c0_g1_i2 [Isarachnanthus nocturnus]